MEEYYFSVNLDNERTLCLAPLTSRKLAMAGDDIADVSGHFLFEKRGTGEDADIELIARVVSSDGVFRLRDMFGME